MALHPYLLCFPKPSSLFLLGKQSYYFPLNIPIIRVATPLLLYVFGLLNYSLSANSCHPLSHSSHALEALPHSVLMLLPTCIFFFPTFSTSYLFCLVNAYSSFRALLQDAFLQSPLCPFWPSILLAAKKPPYAYSQSPMLNSVPIIYLQVRCVCSVHY